MRAAFAAERAAEESRAARMLEDRVLEIAATAGRDARQARRVQVSDFYGHAANAAGAFHRVWVEANRVVQQIAAVEGAVAKVLDTSDSYGVRNLNQQVKAAMALAEDAEAQAKEAEDRMAEFSEAKKQANEYRNIDQRAADRAVEAANVVVSASSDTSMAARRAGAYAAEALWLASRAKMEAAQGKMDRACEAAKRAGHVANLAEEALRDAERAREKARKGAFDLIEPR